MAQSTGSLNKTERPANRPIHTIRYGAIKAAVWRNVVDLGNNSRPMYNVRFSRCYRDGEVWKDSGSFGIDDLLLLAKTADAAHSWILEQRAASDGVGA